MKIFFNDKSIDVTVGDNSYRYQEIMGENSLTLYFSLPEYVDIPVGAWCEFLGQTYTLERPQTIKRQSKRNIEYTLIFESTTAKLKKYKVRNMVDRRLKFPYTAKPQEHLQMIIDNLNQRDSGWTIGEFIDSTEKLISYNHAYCFDALQQIAEKFNTEWQIVGKTIHLKKVEYNKSNPLELSYGIGNGFLPGVGRTNYNNSKAIEVLYVQGGERNIDFSKYGNKELLLPKNATIRYDGTHFDDEPEFVASNARTYITDNEGYSIRRSDKTLQTKEEDSLDLSHIYPSREGYVRELIIIDNEKHFYDFVDDTIPNELDYSDYQIKGEKMTIIFQSGMLSGREFDVNYCHAKKRFEIIPQEQDGIIMPNEDYKPIPAEGTYEGDKYAIFNISLPDAYICNNETKSGASWDMFREAVKYLYENEDPRFSFAGLLNGIWAKKDWINISDKLVLGGYVKFTDNEFCKDGVLIRIINIKESINNPYSPTIELSNVTTGGTISSELGKIEQNEVVVDQLHKEVLEYSKRRFRDSLETLEMVQKGMLHFSEAINPITVQTMAMLIGDQSLQFKFTPTISGEIFFFRTADKKLFAPAGKIKHMTIGINSISSSHAEDEYKVWTMPQREFTISDADKKYYLYAKVSAIGNTGDYMISEIPIDMKATVGYYYLWVAIINSEYEGNRSTVNMYGYSEILPGRITTDRIVSSDGLNFFDFVRNAFRVGNNTNYFDFNSENDGKIKLKGTLIQSPSGDENVLGVFRGSYDSYSLYYSGDEVTYNGSMYRCIQNCPTAGIMPINTTYWRIIAQKGADGNLDDINIGGRNYALDTGVHAVIDGGNIEYAENVTFPLYKIKKEATGGEICYSFDIEIAGFKKGPNAPKIYVQSNETWDWLLGGFADIEVKNGLQHIEVTGSMEGMKDDTVFTLRCDNIICLRIKVSNFKYEKGNKPTDWTPAPEDITAEIDNSTDIQPAYVYQGEYSSEKNYVANNQRIDVVKYNNIYYRAKRRINGFFSNQTPTDNSTYWENFGAQFESVATNLLLSEYANIAGFIFKNNKLISQVGTIDGKPSSDYENQNFIPNIILDGKNAKGQLAGKNFMWDSQGDISMTGIFKSDINGNRVEINPKNDDKIIFKDNYIDRGKFRFTTDVDDTSFMDLILTSYKNGITHFTYYGSSRMIIFPSNHKDLVGEINARGDILRVILKGLPTSPSGLDKGQLWRDGELLKIIQ